MQTIYGCNVANGRKNVLHSTEGLRGARGRRERETKRPTKSRENDRNKNQFPGDKSLSLFSFYSIEN